MRWAVTGVLWMLLMVLPFATMGAVNGLSGPASHAQLQDCSRHCHDHGCSHVRDKYDWDRPLPRAARQLYMANIGWLRGPSMGYKNTNLAVYVVGAPTLFGVLLLGVLRPRAGAGVGWLRTSAVVGLGLAVGALGAVFVVMLDGLEQWGGANLGWALYWYCTDFCIHGANGLGITYEEFNFALFVVGFPMTAVGLVAAAMWRTGTGWGVSR